MSTTFRVVGVKGVDDSNCGNGEEDDFWQIVHVWVSMKYQRSRLKEGMRMKWKILHGIRAWIRCESLTIKNNFQHFSMFDGEHLMLSMSKLWENSTKETFWIVIIFFSSCSGCVLILDGFFFVFIEYWTACKKCVMKILRGKFLGEWMMYAFGTF